MAELRCGFGEGGRRRVWRRSSSWGIREGLEKGAGARGKQKDVIREDPGGVVVGGCWVWDGRLMGFAEGHGVRRFRYFFSRW